MLWRMVRRRRFAITPVAMLVVACMPARDARAQDDPAPPPLDDDTYEPVELRIFDPNPRHSGLYFRGSGLHVDPQEDGRIIDGSGSVDTDDGFGLTLAIGYRDLALPLSIELEYAYRNYETDDYIDPSTMMLADSEISLHTITANFLFDQPDLIGPVGVYAGVGVGARISEFSFRSSGGSSDTDIRGEGFFWQAMAGVNVSLGRETQFYGGVRWTDAGSFDEESLKLDGETFEIELGFRFFF